MAGPMDAASLSGSDQGGTAGQDVPGWGGEKEFNEETAISLIENWYRQNYGGGNARQYAEAAVKKIPFNGAGDTAERWFERLGRAYPGIQQDAGFRKAFAEYKWTSAPREKTPADLAAEEEARQRAYRDRTDAQLEEFVSQLRPGGNWENDPMAQRVVKSVSNRAQERNQLRGLGYGGISQRNIDNTVSDSLSKYDMERQQMYLGGLAGLRAARDSSLNSAMQGSQFEKNFDLAAFKMQQDADRAAADKAQSDAVGQGQGIGAAIGTGIGALGNFFGPAVGAATMAAGGAIGGGIGGLVGGSGTSAYRPKPYTPGSGYRGGGIYRNGGYRTGM